MAAASRDGNSDSVGEKVLLALKRLAWRVGGEHMLFEHLKDNTTGFVTEARLQEALDGSDGVSAAEAFAWLDSNRDGAVGEEELDKKVVRKLFVQQFLHMAGKSGQAVLKSMAQRIPSTKRGKPAVHFLEQMSDEEMREYAAGVLPALIASLTDQREAIKKANKKNRRKDGSSGKFSFKAADKEGETFLFGNLKMFKQGLANLIGLPAAANIKETMEREHQSTDRFTTNNYNLNTFDKQEYYLVDKNADVDYEFGETRVRRNVDELMKSFKEDDVLSSLTREEVVALVLYTGPLFERYNSVLRRVLFPIAEKLQAGEEVAVDATQVDYLTTIHMLVSGVLKLSECTSLAETGRTVYRGLQGRQLPDAFTKADKNGCRGGTELGFMSTTTDIEVAKQYADVEKGEWPMIFAMEVGQVDRGASLQFLSQYPGEAEVLLPPLCNLEVMGDPEVVWEGDFAYWLVRIRLNVNLKSSTREEHEERRKREVIGTASAILLDTKAALQTQMHAPDKTNPKDGTQLYESLLAEANALVSAMREREAGWFNDDGNFGKAMRDLVDLQSFSRETMDAFIHDVDKRWAPYFKQYSMTTWHRLKVGDAREAYARAKQSGDAAARVQTAMKLAVAEGILVEGEPDSKSGLDGETALMRCAAAGDEERLGLLADAKCDLNATSARHCTALLAAVVVGQDGAVKKLLALGADREKGNADMTPLYQAAEHGRFKCLQGLTEAGADIHAADKYKNQPIHLAARNGHLECVKWLKEAGADILVADMEARRPIHRAALSGHLECVKWLVEAGADIHAANNDGWQPIHLAASNGKLECMKWLKEAGADIHAVNKKGEKPIHLAAFGGHLECVKWLKEAGADIHAVNNDGDKTIHLAARNGHLECVKLLKGTGLDILAVNNSGEKPIDCARMKGHVECETWLREAEEGGV